VSGNGSVIQEWKKYIDTGNPIVFDERASVHDACGVLKSFLTSLPERLISSSYVMGKLYVEDTEQQYLSKNDQHLSNSPQN